MWWFHVVVLQRTARTFSQVRAARAARLYSLTPPKKFWICVVVAVLAVDAKAQREEDTVRPQHRELRALGITFQPGKETKRTIMFTSFHS